MNQALRQAHWARFLVLGLTACGASKHGQESHLAHDLKTPTTESKGFMWAEISDEDFKSIVVPMQAAIDRSSGGMIQFMDQKDPLVKKAQQYVDLFDKNLRTKYPDKLASVPKPQVHVRVNDVPNAFVMPVPVCYEAEVVLDPTVEKSPDTQLDAIAVSLDGKVTPPLAEDCVVKHDSKEIEEYVAWANTQSSCQLKTTRDKDDKVVITVGEGCNVSRFLRGTSGAASLMMRATANIVTVFSGIISFQSETQFASVLAHELGHYYRAHPSINRGKGYNYFYQLTENNPEHKPLADEKLRAVGENLKKMRVPQLTYQKVDGQKWRSELFLPMVNVVKTIHSNAKCDKGEDDTCNKKCEDLAVMIADKNFAAAIGNFPKEKLSAEGEKAYNKFSDGFAACVEPVRVSRGLSATTDGNSISSLSFGLAVMSDRNLAPIFSGVSPTDSVIETMLALNKAMDDFDKLVVEPMKKMTDLHIGYYTIEQEADELGVEFMADVGLNPRDAIGGYLALGDFLDSQRETSGQPALIGQLSAKECEQLATNNWLDASGKPAWVSVGDFQDIHHSSCYRAFNLHREIKAHGFTVHENGPAKEVLGSASDWQAIQKSTADIESRMPKTRPASLWDVIFGRTGEGYIQWSGFGLEEVNHCAFGGF